MVIAVLATEAHASRIRSQAMSDPSWPAARIAAHSGDIVKRVKGALEADRAMSEARKKLDWENMYRLAIDPEWARKFRRESESYNENVCSMCGEFCSININNTVCIDDPTKTEEGLETV